jgi:hypothetical protein
MAFTTFNSFSSIINTKTKLLEKISLLIPGNILWLDANDPSNSGNVPANNTSITTWYDKSGLGNNATANIPIVYNKTGMNGYPALSFPLANPSYFTGTISNKNPTLTIFCVISMDSTSSSNARIISLGNSISDDYGSSSYMCLIRADSTNVIRSTRAYQTPGGIVDQGALPYSTPNLVENLFDGTQNYLTLQKGNDTTISQGTSSGNFDISSFGIGVMSNKGATPFVGFMSEIIIYNTYLTIVQRQKIEGYLSWKWGIQANLPTTHPFYNSAPTSSIL